MFAYDLRTSAGGGVWGPEATPEGAGKVRDRAGTGPRHDQLVWTYPLQEGPRCVCVGVGVGVQSVEQSWHGTQA